MFVHVIHREVEGTTKQVRIERTSALASIVRGNLKAGGPGEFVTVRGGRVDQLGERAGGDVWVIHRDVVDGAKAFEMNRVDANPRSLGRELILAQTSGRVQIWDRRDRLRSRGVQSAGTDDNQLLLTDGRRPVRRIPTTLLGQILRCGKGGQPVGF